MGDLLGNQSDFILYTSVNGEIKVRVLLHAETVWLTQKAIAELFDKGRSTITEHLQNIFKDGELDEVSVCRDFRHTGGDGKKYNTKFYNLDAIISVGYRVNSWQATQFRIWATKTLKEYIIKGFVLDDERLKQGKAVFGEDYFDELLERIREIRTSERRFYQKITDIYAECSIDYNRDASVTKNFYATVQNKLHWAIASKTAAEIIKDRANSENRNMGLSTWKNAPKGKILKSDVSVAKNYLNEEEISELNSLINLYLDFAELQAKRKISMKMKDWIEKLDIFLNINQYDILKNSGKISHIIAKTIAENEFDKFRIKQDQEYISDFDTVLKKLKP